VTDEPQVVLDVLARQRAHRAFLPDPVPDADLEVLLTAATHAPSAENRQPWEFVVVTADAGRAAIGELMRRAWEGGGAAMSRDVLPPTLFADVDRGLTGGIAAAPVLVVCCADLRRAHPSTVGSSLFPAIQNLLVAATALGYGSALTTIATRYADELRALLGLPEPVVPVAVVPVGRPGRPLGPGRRDPAATHTHRERWGEPWR